VAVEHDPLERPALEPSMFAAPPAPVDEVEAPAVTP
jgi:hypothetical protein